MDKQGGHRKLGRNEPCYCGSGQKYKDCCISKAGEEAPDAALALRGFSIVKVPVLRWGKLGVLDKAYRVITKSFLVLVVSYFWIYLYSSFGYIGRGPEAREVKRLSERFLAAKVKLEAAYGTREYPGLADAFEKEFYKHDDFFKKMYTGAPTDKLLDFKVTSVKIRDFYYPKGVIWEGSELGEGGLRGKMAYVNYRSKLHIPGGWEAFKSWHFLVFVLAPAIPHGHDVYSINLYQLALYKLENENRWHIYRAAEFRPWTTIERLE